MYNNNVIINTFIYYINLSKHINNDYILYIYIYIYIYIYNNNIIINIFIYYSLIEFNG
jgi:hypothetical protein